MTTTILIELLKKYEKGVSGRSREISFEISRKGKKPKFMSIPEIRFSSAGDGCAGAELTLYIKEKRKLR